MKGQYEDRTRYFVPRRTFTIIRLDGKAFHTYTRGLEKPFDHGLSEDIDSAIIALLPHIQGAQFAYTQSDEISVLTTDFALPNTSAWFDGNVQKIASVSASIMTAEFNRYRLVRACGIESGDKYRETPLAYFDARVFTIPDRIEVMNYFIWRNQDASRNSVSMVAQAAFSHKKLQGVSTLGMKEMLEQTDKPWESYPQEDRYGRIIVKEEYTIPCPPEFHRAGCGGPDVTRTRWVSKPAWAFAVAKTELLNMIPDYE